jgi:hypothetical protein
MRKKAIARYALHRSPLYRVRRRKDLYSTLLIADCDVALLIAQTLYCVKDIVTDRGKARHTETPIKLLRRVHERLTRLLMEIEPPPYLFCPVKGLSPIDNALLHRHHKVICTLDIKNYFPSAPASKVAWFFQNSMQCAPDVSAILAQMITRSGRLPTGSPLSSIMAFYTFFGMWNEIARLAEDGGCIVSVWMDDLTVSGSVVPGELLWAIKRTIHSAGLDYHKVRIYREQPATVTGIVIRDGALLLPHRQHLKSHETRTLAATSASAEDGEHCQRRLRGLAVHRERVRQASERPW